MDRFSHKIPYRLAGTSEPLYQLAGTTNHLYYWVWGSHQGKRVLLGPFKDEIEANREGYAKSISDFEVVPLPTRDRGKATQMMKAKLLKTTGDMNLSLEKISHKGGE